MATSRERVSLRPPPDDPELLTGFPLRVLVPGFPLFRVTRGGRSPWWFGSRMTGRFDLEPPLGTCYLAEDAVSALLEILGADRLGGLVSRPFVESLALWQLEVPEPMELADLTRRHAASLGLTLEIHTVVPYALPQAWAARLQQAGAQGLRYLVRHDPSGGFGIALFGPGGAREDWPADPPTAPSEDLLDLLASETGVTAVPVPRLADLRLAEP